MNQLLAKCLGDGLATLSLTLTSSAQARLVQYVMLLDKWNRAYNLTAVRDPEAMMRRHVIDSLTILPWIKGPRLLDVGSGAGLPGMVVAIACPNVAVSLLDSNGKKVRFQKQVVMELGLSNVTPLHERIEMLSDTLPFDQITSRAFSSLNEFIALSQSVLADGGEWLAMRGKRENEVPLPAAYEQIGCETLNVPGESAERHLVRIKRRCQ